MIIKLNWSQNEKWLIENGMKTYLSFIFGILSSVDPALSSA